MFTATVLIVVLWLAAGSVKVEAISIPVGLDCPAVALEYIGGHVVGNPNVLAATWSCQEVEGEKEGGT